MSINLSSYCLFSIYSTHFYIPFSLLISFGLSIYYSFLFPLFSLYVLSLFFQESRDHKMHPCAVDYELVLLSLPKECWYHRILYLLCLFSAFFVIVRHFNFTDILSPIHYYYYCYFYIVISICLPVLIIIPYLSVFPFVIIFILLKFNVDLKKMNFLRYFVLKCLYHLETALLKITYIKFTYLKCTI